VLETLEFDADHGIFRAKSSNSFLY